MSSTFENNQIPIKRLSNSLSSWVDEKTCFSFFERICTEYDAKWGKDMNPNHWKNTWVRKLLQVHGRLDLTNRLEKDMQTEEIKKYIYPQLITYLKLTCFDQLGQPHKWRTFDAWLNSKKCKTERDNIVKNLKGLDNIKFAEGLYKGYQNTHGVKVSFMRFIREILPKEAREKLLNHIKITIYDESLGLLKEIETTENDKELYLFQIRNDFTHSTFGSYTKGESKDDWFTRDRFQKKKFTYWTKTHVQFENILSESILIGISEIIKKREKNSM